MRIIITAGPTREYIDSVRFITNASSGRMGQSLATAAVEAGHQVTLLHGSGAGDKAIAKSCTVEKFVTVSDLRQTLTQRFAGCDALLMAAAVGDFRPEQPATTKLSRSDGPIDLHLVPTEDVVAAVAAHKRPDQKVIIFCVEDGSDEAIQAKVCEELSAKNADFAVLNTPQAMAAERSRACILSGSRIVLPWADRSKDELARKIIQLLAD